MRPCWPWHLSGGTTELLYVHPQGTNVCAVRIGGTSDLSAGQLIDRTGLLLGLDFPAGKALDALAAEAPPCRGFPVRRNDLTFSLSGMENQVKQLAARGEAAGRIARFVLETLADVVRRCTDAALERYPGLPGALLRRCILQPSAAQRVGRRGLRPSGIFCRQRHGRGHPGRRSLEGGRA